MASKNDDLKKDLDTLYQVVRDTEDKLNNKIDKQDDKLNENIKDMSNLNTNLKNLIDSVQSFIKKFEIHDEKEMLKYEAIEETNRLIDKRLEALEIRDEKYSKMMEDIQKNQNKFFKIIYIGTGVFLTISFLAWLINFILNLMDKLPH